MSCLLSRTVVAQVLIVKDTSVCCQIVSGDVTLGIELHDYTNMDQITVKVKVVYNCIVKGCWC